MTVTTYAPTSSMRAARDRYFAVNDFGEDGGYEDTWVDFELGPIPFPFPNTKGRVEAVRFHDLHHILTAYDTDTVGEMEISAWEIGAGCRTFLAAWGLNLAGMGGGLLIAPRRTFRAFVRGRHSQSFYGRELDGLLDLSVEEARRQTGVDDATGARGSARDAALFAGAVTAGLVAGGAFVAAGVVLAPIGLAVGALRRRARAGAPAAAPARAGAAAEAPTTR